MNQYVYLYMKWRLGCVHDLIFKNTFWNNHSTGHLWTAKVNLMLKSKPTGGTNFLWLFGMPLLKNQMHLRWSNSGLSGCYVQSFKKNWGAAFVSLTRNCMCIWSIIVCLQPHKSADSPILTTAHFGLHRCPQQHFILFIPLPYTLSCKPPNFLKLP